MAAFLCIKKWQCFCVGYVRKSNLSIAENAVSFEHLGLEVLCITDELVCIPDSLRVIVDDMSEY